MKKLVFVVVLGLAVTVMAAPPLFNNWMKSLGASTVIDSAYSADQWELMDSIIIIKSDSANTLYTMSGIAVLDINDRLFLGFDDGGGAGGLPLDTAIVSNFQNTAGPTRVPFYFSYIDSLRSQTDANDTIYFYMAVGGTGNSEKVTVEDVFLTGTVYDYNVAEIIGE